MINGFEVGDTVRVVSIEGHQQYDQGLKIGTDFVIESLSEGRYVDGPYACGGGRSTKGGVYLKNLVLIPQLEKGDVVKVVRTRHVNPETGTTYERSKGKQGKTYTVEEVRYGPYCEGGYALFTDGSSDYLDLLELVKPEPVLEVGDLIEVVDYPSKPWTGTGKIVRIWDYGSIEVKIDKNGLVGTFDKEYIKLLSKAPVPEVIPEAKYAVGETVILNGALYGTERVITSVSWAPHDQTYVYNFEGNFAMRRERELDPKPGPVAKFKVGDYVKINDGGVRFEGFVETARESYTPGEKYIYGIKTANKDFLQHVFEKNVTLSVEPVPEPKFKVGDWVHQTEIYDRVFQVEEVVPISGSAWQQSNKEKWGNFYVAGNGMSAWENYVELTENPRKAEINTEIVALEAESRVLSKSYAETFDKIYALKRERNAL